MLELIKVNNDITLCPTHVEYAEILFELVNKNRDYLRAWLPRTDKITNLDDYKDIISNLSKRFEETGTGAFVIFYKEKIVGTIDLQLLDTDNSIGGFGYWIDENYQKKGIVTLSVQALINYAFDKIKLHKLLIICVKENIRSTNIAERLNFRQEAIFENEFLLNRQYHDVVRYCLFNSN